MFTALTDDHPATTLLAQLAPALAERTEGGVLLVDADFRHPHLAGQFGVDAAVCLSDVLEGKANWSDAVRPTATPRLHLLPGGPIAAEKDRSAGQLDLGRLLRELVRQYALVLVAADSLAHGEVGLIAGGCEGTYLVVQLGQASRRTVRQAARVIERCRGRLLGCVAVEGLGIGD
jgi:Mrp family chromosome partitioning ATPase